MLTQDQIDGWSDDMNVRGEEMDTGNGPKVARMRCEGALSAYNLARVQAIKSIEAQVLERWVQVRDPKQPKRWRLGLVRGVSVEPTGVVLEVHVKKVGTSMTQGIFLAEPVYAWLSDVGLTDQCLSDQEGIK